VLFRSIPALEDKLLQCAVTQILMAIYEADFLPCSYGYRPGRGPHDAVRELTDELHWGKHNFVVEADIKGFFDHLQHDKLLEMLGRRIGDGALLRLIRKWLKAGILEEDGKVIHPELGTPQGGVISPVLANVYLHYVLDLWFEQELRKKNRGQSRLFRFADDFVACFEYRHEAAAFERALPERLAQYGLEVAPEKTKTLRFERFHQLRQLLMAMGSQPLPHPLNRTLQLLARGSSFHRRASLPVRLPAIFKSQKVEPSIMWPAVPAKANHLRLVRGYFQSVLGQPFLQCSLKCRRFVPILEARHKVVRKAEQPALAPILLPQLLLEPEVQNIVQIHVGQHGRDHSPLRGAQFRMDDFSIFFQYACL
jgi:hypothetical protein